MERMAEEGGKLKRKCERELNERQWPRDVIERRWTSNKSWKPLNWSLNRIWDGEWSELNAAAAVCCIFCFIYQPVCLFVAKGCRAAASHCVFISEQLQPVAGRSPVTFTLPAYLSVWHSETRAKMIKETVSVQGFFFISSTSFIICRFPDLFDVLLAEDSCTQIKTQVFTYNLVKKAVCWCLLCNFKGTAHPKMNIQSLSTHRWTGRWGEHFWIFTTKTALQHS